MILLLPMDAFEPRRTIRFVCMLPTGSGELVTDRKAAAAAADERLPFEGGRAMKAWAAAVAAADRVVWSRGTALCRLALLPRLRENMLGMVDGYPCRQPKDAVNAPDSNSDAAVTQKNMPGPWLLWAMVVRRRTGNVIGFRGNASWRGQSLEVMRQKQQQTMMEEEETRDQRCCQGATAARQRQRSLALHA